MWRRGWFKGGADDSDGLATWLAQPMVDGGQAILRWDPRWDGSKFMFNNGRDVGHPRKQWTDQSDSNFKPLGLDWQIVAREGKESWDAYEDKFASLKLEPSLE